MIPRTFPSTYASNGQQQMLVHFLTDVSGLQRWSDYIPVKLAQTGTENSYANNGYIDVKVLSPLTASTQAWKEYIPVYVDDEATDTWTVNAIGYIPYGYALFGDASMQLDFTNGGALDPRITFTRSTTATYTGSNGLIQTAAIDAPRFDYEPATLAPKGLLIEEQRTNLLLRSEDFTTTWFNTDSSEQANATTSPDNTLTADKLVEGSLTAFHAIQQDIATVSATSHTFSVFAKYSERNIQLFFGFANVTGNPVANFDLQNGVLGTTTGTITSSIQNYGNGWYKCSVTVTSAVTSAFSCFIGLTTSTSAGRAQSYQGNGTSGAFLWGAQLEAGAFSTSYIPTVASQVTRTADNAVMTGTNFSSWYNQAEGTLLSEGQVDTNRSTTGAVRHTANITPELNSDSGLGFFVNDAATFENTVRNNALVEAQLIAGTNTGAVFKIAGAYQVNNFAFSANGGAPVTDTIGAVPTTPAVTQMKIGGGRGGAAGGQLNGHVRRITFYPRRLANSELQAITS